MKGKTERSRLWLNIFFVAFLALTACAKPEENVRLPAAAGQFYPADPAELYSLIDRLIKASPSKGIRNVRAVLVPHAGYPYSGAVAAESFREVDPDFKRIFLLAANHRGDVDFSGVSLPRETHYAIPGASISLSGILAKLRRQPGFVDEPAAHSMHMIEAELPFLHFLKKQSGRSDFEIVPMIVGRMDQTAISRLAETLNRYADNRTLFVFSVDLSHYFPEGEARKLDGYTIQSTLSRDAEGLSRATTDGNQVLLTLLALADLQGWEATFLMYRNSASAGGDTSRVVGYAGIAFHEPLSFTEEEKKELLRIARSAVGEAVRTGNKPKSDSLVPTKFPIFNIPRGVFVTLKENGELRGCIGSLFPQQSLFEGVLQNAVKAAKEDPRFPPVAETELDRLAVSISVLDYPRRLKVADPSDYPKALKPKEDGIILAAAGGQSTFLPQVWEDIPRPEDFLSALCRKQGAKNDCWRDAGATLYRYRAFEFGE